MIDFFIQNKTDLIIGILLFGIVIAVLYKMRKDKKNGKSCGCSGCNGCSGCAEKDDFNKKRDDKPLK